ncbi:hypothetical protein [Falsiroseomonas sp.]|uniref:hypothetical protein n=1 Tax=Falsiroseomonas sp. TaxID=2870721 RepID=UPI003F72D50A
MRRLLLVAPLILAGCGVSPAFRPTTPAMPGPDGLPAMQFTRTVRLEGPVGNRLEFVAGAVLVADRTRDEDGATLWCGPVQITDITIEQRPTCITRDGDSVQLVQEIRGGGWQRTLPAGSYREFRLR